MSRIMKISGTQSPISGRLPPPPALIFISPCLTGFYIIALENFTYQQVKHLFSVEILNSFVALVQIHDTSLYSVLS